MTDRPTCPDCGKRPLPSPQSKRCLACAKKRPGGAWRQMLARRRDKDGEFAARRLAKEQGVPFSCAASPADGPPPPLPPAAAQVHPGPESGELQIPDTLEPHHFAELSSRCLYLVLAQCERDMIAGDITAGQAAQLIKPLHTMWSEVAGGTTATRIHVVWGDA